MRQVVYTDNKYLLYVDDQAGFFFLNFLPVQRWMKSAESLWEFKNKF